MKRILLAALAAALAMNAWGFVFWVLLPSGPWALEAAAEEPALAEALLTYLPATGTYFTPSHELAWEEMQRRQEIGPVATIHFRRDGIQAASPWTFVAGFVHLFLLCLAVAGLLRAVGSALPRFGGRVLFVWTVGLIGTLFVGLSYPIWWHQPWQFHLTVALYSAGAWLLAGLVLGWSIRSARLRF